MFVLMIGHRRGLQLALEKLSIPYAIWSLKEVKNPTKAHKLIFRDYPETKLVLNRFLFDIPKVTHVIAGTEDAVFPASKIRIWLETRRNPLGIILRCTDKLAMKQYLQAKGIPMTPFVGGGEAQYRPDELFELLGAPVVTKPRKSSGSRGLKKVYHKEELAKEMNPEIILEKIIYGNEGSVESFIQDGKVLFSNVTEYYKLGHCNLLPSSYSESLKSQLLSLNLKVIQSLQIQWGMTHMEFYIDNDRVLFGEIALRPPGGYIMEALSSAYGQNFWEIFVKIELDIPVSRWPQASQYASSLIFHPGEGIVLDVQGENLLKKLASFKKCKLKVKAGDRIMRREGLGQDYGYAILVNSDLVVLKKDINTAFSNFNIIMSKSLESGEV